MITEKETIKCEAVFSEDHTHRFLLKRTWNKNKPLAAVIMLNPCHADSLITDTTTFLVVNNVARMEEFGGVAILNLYSILTSKLNFKWNADDDLNRPENNEYIVRTAEEAKVIILAWGRAQDVNRRVAERAVNVINLLLPFKEKLFLISDGERVGMHPLTPSLRNRWLLETFDDALEKRKLQEQERIKTSEKAKPVSATNESPQASIPEVLENISEEAEPIADGTLSTIKENIIESIATPSEDSQV